MSKKLFPLIILGVLSSSGSPSHAQPNPCQKRCQQFYDDCMKSCKDQDCWKECEWEAAGCMHNCEGINESE